MVRFMFISSMVFSIRSEAYPSQSALNAKAVDWDCIARALAGCGEAPLADWAGECDKTGDKLGMGVG